MPDARQRRKRRDLSYTQLSLTPSLTVVSGSMGDNAGNNTRRGTPGRASVASNAPTHAVTATGGSPAEQLRQQLLRALEDARGPMTTAQLRQHVQEQLGQPVVIESVYRNLTVLERRGEVRRDKPSGRNIRWLRAR